MLPAIRGVIDRRILVNYRVDPGALDELLPHPFRPQTVDGHGIGGICLIRLRDLRPQWLPTQLGMTSENAAHRIAIEWDEDGERRAGVYVPRRDTNSRFNTLLGGRLFPGVHYHATFDVHESDGRYELSMASDDGDARVEVAGKPTDSLPDDSVFRSIEAASTFFERGSLGYSPNERTGEFEALELHTFDWDVTPLAVDSVASSYFDGLADEAVAFDHALLMRDIAHEWREGDPLCSVPTSDRDRRPTP